MEMNRLNLKIPLATLLIALSVLYTLAVAGIVSKLGLNSVAFAVSLMPLIITIAGIWMYEIKGELPKERVEHMPVDRLMQPAYKITPDKTVSDAEKLMEKTGADLINITDKSGKLVGVFTKADAHVARKQRKSGERVDRFMTPLDRIIKVNKGEKLIEVMEKMGKTKHSRLPVMDGDKVVGVIDSVDIQDFLAKVLKTVK